MKPEVVHICNPSVERQKQVDCQEFKACEGYKCQASLGYTRGTGHLGLHSKILS